MKISVVAHPNSKKTLPVGRQAIIEKDLLGTLHIYVKQPPLENKANIAVIEALTEYFKVRKGEIIFLSGNKSKIKVFEINGK
jgi:uncharacterized protein YggU (UPF0235/DUF167 family)